jgi:L-histidine Nalpha-methyltransferase
MLHLQGLNSQLTHSNDAFARAVQEGFSRTPKSLPSAWFYDERGSQLFEQITELDEYDLTRCERQIFESQAAAIAAQLPREPFRLVELGAGDGHKTRVLLRELIAARREFEYLPIDICRASVEKVVSDTQRELSQLMVRGLAGEYMEALASVQHGSRHPLVVLFLGSSVGNFTHSQTRNFLWQVRDHLRISDQMLIGFDLQKDPRILQRAYDDASGITREFNLNLLDRINCELGGEFDRNHFLHHAIYNPQEQRMESWLISRREQRIPVRRLNRLVRLAQWEGIHVESSYKYSLDQIADFAAGSEFAVEQNYFDDRQWFVDSLWRAEG